jgi:hypothetical protein
MGLKDRLKRGQQKTGLGRRVLVCPECGAEFVVWGDAAVEYLCTNWVQGNGGVAHGIDLDAAALVERGTPPDVATLFDHEHDSRNFIYKRSGLPFLSREAGGVMGPASRSGE